MTIELASAAFWLFLTVVIGSSIWRKALQRREALITLRTVWLQHARKRQLRQGELAEDEAGTAMPALDPEAGLDLERALDRLAPYERLCVLLSYSEGMSHAEIARAAAIPLGTVKSHIARGMTKLRALLGNT